MTNKKKKRNPFLAALLSLLAPGLGQIYNGQGALGITFFLISLSLPFLGGVAGLPRRFAGLVALGLTAIAFSLFTIIHAYVQARRLKETESKKYQTAAVYAFVIILSLGLTRLVPIRTWMSLTGVFPYQIATGAMEPALQQGDFLMTDLKAYHDRAPRRGDLIVFQDPRDATKDFVKRVIGLEGDKIEIRDKQVHINGEPIAEPYKIHLDSQVYAKDDARPSVDTVRDNFGPLEIPAGHYFVLGDNRDNSLDSRYWGALPLANIKSRALYVYWAKDKKRIGLTPK
jgi:signal peptidase I